jgi:glycolate oxidase iron-sulfur subunit
MNVDAFEQWNLDAIIINAAGCGAALKEYDRLLADDPAYAERAERFSEKVEDISEFLARVGLTAPLGTVERKITYDDPCHLVHGQKVSLQPRALLSMIPGLEYVELRDADRCCGSAGIYNILQPDMSMRVLDDKTEAILESGAETIVTANPGCLIQINAGLRQAGQTASAQHIVDLLDEAIQAGQREQAAAR